MLYGATAGQLFANGEAGERLCVRNSGATAIVEGCGSNGCEYMTGGEVVILGPTGHNFGAGMTGGMAYIYDAEEMFEQRANPETLVIVPLTQPYWQNKLKELVELHKNRTESEQAAYLLNNWENEVTRFKLVVPKEIVDTLAHPIQPEAEESQSA